MCEFCSFGPPNSSNNNNRQQDRNDPFSFGGFFSADAINEAVRISKQQQQQQQQKHTTVKPHRFLLEEIN